MANEAILIVENEIAVPYDVVDGTGIEKGTLVQLSGSNMTCEGVTSGGTAQAGILIEEKIANDGRTSVPVHRRGSGNIYKLTLSGACIAGDALEADSSLLNRVRSVAISISGTSLVGHALEDGADGETIMVEQR